MRKAEKTFTETKIINGGKFSIVKCAEFGVERSSRKRKQGIRCGGGRVKMEDLEACGPGEAVVEMEQQRPGEDLKASGPGKAAVVMKQPCLGGDIRKEGTSVPKRRNCDMNRKGSFPKCAGEQPKVNNWAGRPTNVKNEIKPENVQNLLNPTNNIKLAEMPPKYKKTNVSTRKVVKFENINLLETRLENRLEIVSDVVVVDSTVKQSVEKEYIVEARSSPVEKNEAGSHQEKNETRNQKRKRLEEKNEESPRKKKFGRGGDSVSVFDQKCEPNRAGGGGSNVKN